MKGFLTSFVGQFGPPPEDAPFVERVEIPLIQRDYAQGRQNTAVNEIRSTFLQVLLDAVADGDPVGLDFVYGNVDSGTFRPLDGQQRLTTLFLLHWYFGSGAGQVDTTEPWTQFTYATRPSAELFCRKLIENPLPPNGAGPAAWITDQPWYLHTWRNDPTIQGMLVVLDEIHELTQRQYPHLDPLAAWDRLVDTADPVISFYFLALPATDSDEELYIKMNSRGKPLTPFENFKAHFEQDIGYDPVRAEQFANKIDGQWADLLWPYHGGDNIVDDEFMRYIEFVTEICELRDVRMGSGNLGRRAHATYGEQNQRAGEHLDFLFAAFDCWTNEQQIASTFDDVFSTTEPGAATYDSSKVLVFNVAGVNLFESCCHTFEGKPFGQRAFTLQQSLYLYAVLLHLIDGTDDFPRRARTLRNLIASSDDEIRRQNMPELVADVKHVIVNDDLDAVKRFSTNQLADERLKREFLAAHSDLTEAVCRLEDHPLLRGTLACFAYDPERFSQRAQAFEAAFSNPSHWAALTGALLATGDYQHPRTKGWQFGTGAPKNSDVWRRLLTNASRDALAPTRDVLAEFLDGLAGSSQSVEDHCAEIMAAWLVEREHAGNLDWRYYLVKYPSLRSGLTGIYVGSDGKLGYSMCMLNATQLNGYYRDPILLGAWELSGIGELAADQWFIGYETLPRWLRLVRTYTGLRSVAEGFELERPVDEAGTATFEALCAARDDIVIDGERTVLAIPQSDDGIDEVDRVVVGAALLKGFVAAGL